MVKKAKPVLVTPPGHEAEKLTMEILEQRVHHLEVCNNMLIQAVKMLKDQVRELQKKGGEIW